MRSLFTRAARDNKGHRLTPVAFIIFVVAAFFVFTSAMSKAAFRQTPQNDNITTGSLPQTLLSTDDTRLHHAEQGSEGLDLAARLTEEGGFIQRLISWQIFQRNGESGKIGKSIFNKKTSIVEAQLDPGDYHIEINYGYAKLIRDVTILPKTRIGITFILNVGGVRTLSRVKGMDASAYSKAQHAIFHLRDNGPAKLIADTIAQGQIIRLAAGRYRIDSRFDNGNTIASANVTIKPGILTSLNIDHQAALAKIAFLSAPDSPVLWQVLSHKGRWTRTGKSLHPAMILAPGRYTFSATIGEKKFSRTVSIAKGKSTTVILGN